MEGRSEEAGDELHNNTCCFSTPEVNCISLPCYVLALATWPASRLSKPRALLHLQKLVIHSTFGDDSLN